jgi:hypothetical protein
VAFESAVLFQEGFPSPPGIPLPSTVPLTDAWILREAPPEPVELPDHERIAGPHVGQGFLQTGPLGLGSAGLVGGSCLQPAAASSWRSRFVECLIGWLKECRQVSSRFEKTAVNFGGMIKMAFIQ